MSTKPHTEANVEQWVKEAAGGIDCTQPVAAAKAGLAIISLSRAAKEGAKARSERDALQTRVAELEREREQFAKQANDFQAERDALRAQVEKVSAALRRLLGSHIHLPGSGAFSQHLAPCGCVVCEALDALSAPPAEAVTERQKEDAALLTKLWERHDALLDEDEAPPAETPAPERQETEIEAPLLCERCARWRRGHSRCNAAGCECFCGRIRVVTGAEMKRLQAGSTRESDE